MNLVDALQCCSSRGWQSVAPEVDLRKCTLHLPVVMRIKQNPLWLLKPRGDVTRNPKQGYQWPQNRTCECVRQKKTLKKKRKKKDGAHAGSPRPSLNAFKLLAVHGPLGPTPLDPPLRSSIYTTCNYLRLCSLKCT